MQTQSAGEGAARPRRSGTDAPPSGGHRRLPGTEPHSTLVALTSDLDRLAAPLPAGAPIIDPSRPAHPAYAEPTHLLDREAAEIRSDADAIVNSGAADAPIFVDSSGQRRKLARRLSIGVVGILGGYSCLVALSFAGGPIPPAALLPVPGLPGAKDPGPQPAPAAPAPVAPTDASASHTSHSTLPNGRSTGARTSTPGSQPSTVPGLTPTGALPATPLPATPQPSGVVSTTTVHGNPTPPGRTKHSSAAPTS